MLILFPKRAIFQKFSEVTPLLLPVGLLQKPEEARGIRCRERKPNVARSEYRGDVEADLPCEYVCKGKSRWTYLELAIVDCCAISFLCSAITMYIYLKPSRLLLQHIFYPLATSWSEVSKTSFMAGEEMNLKYSPGTEVQFD